MIQGMLPIEFAPNEVIEYGLRDAHSYPLVSHGKDEYGHFTGSFRVSPEVAWEFPSIELRAANSWPCLIFDIDSPSSVVRARKIWTTNCLPPPSWIVQKASGGAHAVYTLVSPVHRGSQAAKRPLMLAARISEFYAMELRADTGYAGVLSHNPTFTEPLLDGTMYETTWWREGGYHLSKLKEAIPQRWRKPAPPHTELGRNCYLFDKGMRWAGTISNVGLDVLPILDLANDFLNLPIGWSELNGIARSVERYRSKWISQGLFYSIEDARMHGIKSGKARRKRSMNRDKHIIYLANEGVSHGSIAEWANVTRRRIGQIIKRDFNADGRVIPGDIPTQRFWGGSELHR